MPEKKKKDKRVWMTGALRKRASSLAPDSPFWKETETIASLRQSDAMKHVLAVWALELALEGKKLPDKPLSRKKTGAFKELVEQVTGDDMGTFRISSLVSVICASLCCMFLGNVMNGRYLINFSIDALIAAAAAGILFVNLGVSMRTVRIYGSARDFILTDLAALILWFLLHLLWPQFDASLLIFLIAYLFEKRTFSVMQKRFVQEI